jgi:hypothetical protein
MMDCFDDRRDFGFAWLASRRAIHLNEPLHSGVVRR